MKSGQGAVDTAMVVVTDPQSEMVSLEWAGSNSIRIVLKKMHVFHVLTSLEADVRLPSGALFSYLMKDDRDPDRSASAFIEGDRFLHFVNDLIPVVERAADRFRQAVEPAEHSLLRMAGGLGWSMEGARVLLLSFLYLRSGITALKLSFDGMFPLGEHWVAISATAGLDFARRSRAHADIEIGLPRSAYRIDSSLKDAVSEWADQALSAALRKKRGVRWKREIKFSHVDEKIVVCVSQEMSGDPDWGNSLTFFSAPSNQWCMTLIPIPVPAPSSPIASLFADAFSALGEKAGGVAERIASALSTRPLS